MDNAATIWLLRTFRYGLPKMGQLRENRSVAERGCELLKQGWRGLPRLVRSQPRRGMSR